MKRNSAAVLAVILTICCVFSGCGIVRKMPFANTVKQAAQPTVAFHTGDPAGLTESVDAGAGALRWDPENLNFAYADGYTGAVWSVLPTRNNTLASAVSAALISRDGRYFLNSQDNAVAFGTAEAEKTDGGLRITYSMAQSAEIAQAAPDDVPEGEPYLRLTLELTAEEGKLTAAVDCAAVTVADGFILEKLTLLPYFGALSYESGAAPVSADPESEPVLEEGEALEIASADAGPAEEDYLVVPDGCGAVIRTGLSENDGMNYAYAVHSGDGVNSPFVPAAVFGLKKGAAAFVCAVTEGDAVSTVRAVNLMNEGASFNMAYAEFLITDTSTQENRVYYGAGYTGSVRLVYKFLGGVTADYVSMASAAGEELIRAGILPNAAITDTVVPLNVGLICSADGSKNTVVSTYEQAEDMLSVLKAKGVNRANILLQGAFAGGLGQKSSSPLRPVPALGGRASFEALCDYAEKQSIDLYAGVNLLTAGKGQAAVSTDGSDVTTMIRNPLYPDVGLRVYPAYLLRADRLERAAVRMLSSAERLDLKGICVNDAAINLYEDRRADANRADTETRISEELNAAAAGNKLVMNGADLGAVENASLITSLPFDVCYGTENSDAYEAVPFIPAMLHGKVLYTGAAANQQGSPYLYLLKTVEFGGTPYYEWVCAQGSHLYYENGLSEALEFLNKMNEKLGDLLSEPLSGHRKLRDGVYRTTYENGAVVFVNYNNYSVIVNGITVSPYDFLRLN